MTKCRYYNFFSFVTILAHSNYKSICFTIGIVYNFRCSKTMFCCRNIICVTSFVTIITINIRNTYVCASRFFINCIEFLPVMVNSIKGSFLYFLTRLTNPSFYTFILTSRSYRNCPFTIVMTCNCNSTFCYLFYYRPPFQQKLLPYRFLFL